MDEKRQSKAIYIISFQNDMPVTMRKKQDCRDSIPVLLEIKNWKEKNDNNYDTNKISKTTNATCWVYITVNMTGKHSSRMPTARLPTVRAS